MSGPHTRALRTPGSVLRESLLVVLREPDMVTQGQNLGQPHHMHLFLYYPSDPIFPFLPPPYFSILSDHSKVSPPSLASLLKKNNLPTCSLDP